MEDGSVHIVHSVRNVLIVRLLRSSYWYVRTMRTVRPMYLAANLRAAPHQPPALSLFPYPLRLMMVGCPKMASSSLDDTGRLPIERLASPIR